MSATTHTEQNPYRAYLVGFALSLVLTIVPFALVLSDVPLTPSLIIAVIFVFGAAQILVHVRYFLHVDLKNEQGWQVMSLAFTATLLIIVLAGSIWVMVHLRENMMPAHEQIERVRNLP